jgi:hypothetical protein
MIPTRASYMQFHLLQIPVARLDSTRAPKEEEEVYEDSYNGAAMIKAFYIEISQQGMVATGQPQTLASGSEDGTVRL